MENYPDTSLVLIYPHVLLYSNENHQVLFHPPRGVYRVDTPPPGLYFARMFIIRRDVVRENILANKLSSVRKRNLKKLNRNTKSKKYHSSSAEEFGSRHKFHSKYKKKTLAIDRHRHSKPISPQKETLFPLKLVHAARCAWWIRRLPRNDKLVFNALSCHQYVDQGCAVHR